MAASWRKDGVVIASAVSQSASQSVSQRVTTIQIVRHLNGYRKWLDVVQKKLTSKIKCCPSPCGVTPGHSVSRILGAGRVALAEFCAPGPVADALRHGWC